MRSILKFIINVLLIIGVIWLLMKFTPIGDRVRDFWAKKTTIVTSVNGSGSKIDTSCQTPWGVKIPNGGTIFAYKDLVPTKDGLCEEEVRICKKGVLNGTFAYPSCLDKNNALSQESTGIDQGNGIMADGILPNMSDIPANGASCETPRGQTIKNGNYIVSYQSPSSCTFQRRVCVDGTLLGKFEYNYCILPTYYAASSQGLLDVTADSVYNSPYSVGSAWQYAQVNYGGINATQTLPSDYWNQNEKGSVAIVSSSTTKTTPTKKYATTKDTSSTAYYDLTQRGCTTPWGSHVDHGQYIIAYRTTIPATGRSCEYERRSCNYGKLSGSFTASKCTIQGKTYTSSSRQPGNVGIDQNTFSIRLSCRLPWGGYIADGAYVKAFRSYSAPYNDGCVGEYRFCRNGVLDGSYTNKTCSLGYNYAGSCSLPWGGSIGNGQSVLAYSSPSGNCYSQTRTCINGYLNGTYSYNSCTSYNYSNMCTLPRGGSIGNGQSIVAYSSPLGNCYAQTRTCINGYLDGSYQYNYCNNTSPQTTDDIYGSWENVGRLDETPSPNVDTCNNNYTNEYICSHYDVKTCVDYKKVEDDCCVEGRAKYQKREITCVR